MLRRLFSVLLVSVLGGCDFVGERLYDDVAYRIERPIEQNVSILVERLSHFPGSLFSSIEYDRKNSVLTFKNGAPEPQVIKFLATTLGEFSVYGEDFPHKRIKNDHIVLAQASEIGAQRIINFKLSDQGAKLLSAITTINMDKQIFVELDGEIIMSPYVRDTLSKRFMMTVDGNSLKAKLTAVSIQSGSLSQAVQLSLLK